MSLHPSSLATTATALPYTITITATTVQQPAPTYPAIVAAIGSGDVELGVDREVVAISGVHGLNQGAFIPATTAATTSQVDGTYTEEKSGRLR